MKLRCKCGAMPDRKEDCLWHSLRLPIDRAFSLKRRARQDIVSAVLTIVARLHAAVQRKDDAGSSATRLLHGIVAISAH